MSTFGYNGYKWIYKSQPESVRLTPENGHSEGGRRMSAYDPNRTFTAGGVNGIASVP